MRDIVERFLKYVGYETTSYEPKENEASSYGQYVLAKELAFELEELGAKDVTINEFGTVCATFKGDLEGPSIALIAHQDTSNSASGKDIKARIVDYKGGTIELSTGISLDPEEFKHLQGKEGHKLIVTDGTTLLGGDDKAGIAIIMNVVERLIESKESHRTIRVIFSTDEEIGVGADHIKPEELQAEFGYTVDGGSCNLINVENFNAGRFSVTINGRSIHPGDAKDKMINAINVAVDFQSALPRYERPEHTSNREGFYHLMDICGNEEKCTMKYIVRDHDLGKLLHRIELAKQTAKRINDSYKAEIIVIEAEDNSYRNMLPELEKHPEVIERIIKAYDTLGIKYEFEPIRGGTDGATLTNRGFPCPNLGTGDYNCHGRFEFVDIDEMKTMSDIVMQIVKTK